MAFAQALGFIGNLLWPSVGLPQYGSAFFSATDLYFLFYLIFALGLFLIPMPMQPSQERARALLDMGILSITSSMLFWAFLIWPIIHSGAKDAIPTSVIYPVLDLLLLFGVLRLLYHGMRPHQKIPLAILACAILANIMADVIFMRQSLEGTFAPGGWMDSIPTIYYLLFGLAGIWHAESPWSGPGDLMRFEPQWTRHLPSISIIPAYVLLAWTYGPVLHDPFFLLLLGTGGVIALATVRQTMVMNENYALSRAAGDEISKRKAAEERYRSLVDNSLQGMMIIQDEAVAFVNQAMADMTGLQRG